LHAFKQFKAFKKRFQIEGNFMPLILIFSLLTLFISASAQLAEAQQPKKVPRIGVLSPSSPGPSPLLDAFRQGLRELGYVEGKT
jgi:hypothetical protein